MRTFPSVPSLQDDHFVRMLPDSTGVSLDDSSLDVGHSTFVTLRGPDDVASEQQSLSAQFDERIRQLAAARDEMWAPLDLAGIVHRFVPRSSSLSGTFSFFVTLSSSSCTQIRRRAGKVRQP